MTISIDTGAQDAVTPLGQVHAAIDAACQEARNLGLDLELAVAAFRRSFISQVLREHRGNQCKAAADLHMHRNTLSRACAELMIDAAAYRNQGLRR
jgi:DNA-binding NtrC family response regulator